MRFLDPNIIIVKDRTRQDLGDIPKLANEIDQVGQLNPIMVEEVPGEGYVLLHGHRRLEACRLLERKVWVSTSQEANVLVENDLHRKRIELMENFSRKEMSPVEEARLVNRLHELMQEIYGQASAGRPKDAEIKAWGLRDTASLVGYRSHHPIRDAILVAKASETEVLPALKKAHTINEASSIVRNVMKEEAKQELLRRRAKKIQAQSPLKKEPQNLERYYGEMILQGDCLTLLEGLPPNFIDYILTDPPYGVGFSSKDTSHKHLGNYEDQKKEPFRDWELIISQFGRVCAPDSYIIMFCSMRWFNLLCEKLSKYGFVCYVKPIIWVQTYEKSGAILQGKSYSPGRFPASSYDAAIFAVRGNLELAIQGWPDVIFHPMVGSGDKIHVAQKPVGLWKTLLERLHHPGTQAKMLDPFCGSGSSLAAALQVPGITPLGMEIDSKFRERAIYFLIENHLDLDVAGIGDDLMALLKEGD